MIYLGLILALLVNKELNLDVTTVLPTVFPKAN